MLEEKHIALLSAHYTSIGHAIVDVHTNKKHAYAYTMLGDETTLENLLSSLYKIVTDTFQGLLNIVTEKIAENWALISHYSVDPELITNLQNILQKIAESTGKIAKKLICSFFDLVARFWNYMSSLVGYETIIDAQNETDTCKKLLEQYGETVYSVVRNIANQLISIVSYVFNGMVSAVENIYTFVVDTMNSIIKNKDRVTRFLYDQAVKVVSYFYALGIETLCVLQYASAKVQEYLNGAIRVAIEYLVQYKTAIKGGAIVYDFVTTSPVVAAIYNTIRDTISVMTMGQNIVVDFAYLLVRTEWATRVLAVFITYQRRFITAITEKMYSIFNTMIDVATGLVYNNEIDVETMQLKKLLEKLKSSNVTTSAETKHIDSATGYLDQLTDYYTKFNNTYKYENTTRIWTRIKNGVELVSIALHGEIGDETQFNNYVYEQIGMTPAQYIEYTYAAHDYAKSVAYAIITGTKAQSKEEFVAGRVLDEYQQTKLAELLPAIEAAMAIHDDSELEFYKSRAGITDKSIDTLELLYAQVRKQTSVFESRKPRFQRNANWMHAGIFGALTLGLYYGIPLLLSRYKITYREQQIDKLVAANIGMIQSAVEYVKTGYISSEQPKINQSELKVAIAALLAEQIENGPLTTNFYKKISGDILKQRLSKYLTNLRFGGLALTDLETENIIVSQDEFNREFASIFNLGWIYNIYTYFSAVAAPAAADTDEQILLKSSLLWTTNIAFGYFILNVLFTFASLLALLTDVKGNILTTVDIFSSNTIRSRAHEIVIRFLQTTVGPMLTAYSLHTWLLGKLVTTQIMWWQHVFSVGSVAISILGFISPAKGALLGGIYKFGTEGTINVMHAKNDATTAFKLGLANEAKQIFDTGGSIPERTHQFYTKQADTSAQHAEKTFTFDTTTVPLAKPEVPKTLNARQERRAKLLNKYSK